MQEQLPSPPQLAPEAALQPSEEPSAVPSVETTRLPAACIRIPYSARLEALGGGGGPYIWRALSALPPGLQLDAISGELSGVPMAVGRLTLQAVDGLGVPSAAREFALEQRESCWLAYLSAQGGASQLYFGDVFASPGLQVRLPSALAAGESVADFQFAPNGSWIALRVRTAAGFRVELYATALDASGALARSSTPVAFTCPTPQAGSTCSVLEYAWSDDSQRLAVVLGGATPEQDYLSGIDLAAPAAPWASLGDASFAGGSIPFDHHDQLVWVGHDWLGLIAADPEPSDEATETLYSAFVASDGRSLERLTPTTATVGRGRLRALPAGLLLSNEGTDEVFQISYGADPTSSADDVLRGYLGRVSPSGRLLASANDEGRLQVGELGADAEAPLETDRGECYEILAWSERVAAIGLERIACRGEGSLNIFDYSDPPAQSESDPPPRSRLAARASPAAALTGVRRAFSPSAGWFVFGNPAGAYFTLDISSGSSASALQLIHTDASADMQFATHQDVVAFLGTDALLQYPLPRSRDGFRAYDAHGGATATSVRCEETGITRWCGAPHVENHVSYSADSHSLMFEGPSGVLWLAEMNALPAPASARQLTAQLPECSVNCKGVSYAFK
jgi:hypothetical protein